MGVLLVLLAAACGVYGLHRLMLWMEARGWVYYLNKKPEGHVAGSLTVLHEILEPQTKHVEAIKNEKRALQVEHLPGVGAPPVGGEQAGGSRRER